MIQPISMLQSNISFTGKHRYKMNDGNPDLKRLWDQGKLPEVKYGFYGDELKLSNVTREHLEPASLGGTKRFGNIVLASKAKNNARGNKDITLFANPETVKQYFEQFKDICIKELNGNAYIRACKKTLKRLGMTFK